MSKRKAPAENNNLNQDITDFLIELANYERNTNRNIHKYNAYRKAASVLATYNKRVESGEEAKKLNGIGEKIAKKIDEFLTTGKLEKLEKIRKDDTSVTINLFTRVSGIGPSKARELVQMGIKTIEDLRPHQDKLTHHQQIGLKYFEDFEEKIPRKEIKEIEKRLKTCIQELDNLYCITICGSYRRGRAESGDVDVLISHPSYASKSVGSPAALLKNVVDCLQCNDLIIDTIALGDSKYMGVCRIGRDKPARRLDIRLCACEEYVCSVLYFTGSDVFNRQMRQHALDRSFTLNEYSLRPLGSTDCPGEPLPVTCEQDVFEYIDMPYTEPRDRDL